MIKMSMKVYATAFGSLAVGLGSLAIAVGACSSPSGAGDTGSSSSKSNSGSGSSSSSSTTAAGGGACTGADDIFEIVFAPMYSASIPGDSGVSFQIPAIVSGVTPSAVTWSASSNAVSLSADPTTGGVLITTLGTGSGGPVTIVATAGGSCGQSTLNITESTLATYQAGKARYNNGVALPASGMGLFNPPDGGATFACVDCHAEHGMDAGAGAGFNDIAHTPEQTGGYSDEQLLAIVQTGTVPGYSPDGGASADAGYFDPTIVSYKAWNRFHRWNLTTEEQAGIVTYLRSLTPTAQNGTSNFGGFGGGHPPPDGGYKFPDGGMHHHHDGGFGGGSGSGSESSSAATSDAGSGSGS